MQREMPRDEESEDSDSEYSTDTDDEHVPPSPLAALANKSKISAKALDNVYKKQRGMCRITGIPIAMIDACIVPRKLSKPISDDNFMIVMTVMEQMRAASKMNWRQFVRLLQMCRDAEL